MREVPRDASPHESPRNAHMLSPSARRRRFGSRRCQIGRRCARGRPWSQGCLANVTVDDCTLD